MKNFCLFQLFSVLHIFTQPVLVNQTAKRQEKAHYTRYLKKKMTAAQFERWSRFAVELRRKVEQGEISLESYVAELKK